MIKNKVIAVIVSALVMVSFSCCSNDSERIEDADNLPTVSSRETSVPYFEETETEAVTSNDYEGTTVSTRERSTELATTTETRETITLPPETEEIPIFEYSTQTVTTEEQSYQFTVSQAPSPFTDDTGTITSNTGSKLAPYKIQTEIKRPYSYYQMTPTQQYVYDSIVICAQRHKDQIPFDLNRKITDEDLYFVYQTLFIDQTDTFYLDPTVQYLNSNPNGYVSRVYFEYLYSQEESEKMISKTKAAADEIIAKITPSMNEYDIVKLFHDEIIKKCNYNENTEHCMDIYGCFVEGEALCQAYARAFVYLCNKVGIQSMIISGVASGEAHMWNMVNVGGDWYHIDLTWNDANNSSSPEFIRYDYFCVNDEMINRLRTVDAVFYDYPAATADKCNYYVYNDYVAKSSAEAEKLMKEAVYNASVNKEPSAQIVCSSKEVYDKASVKLFDYENGTALGILESVYDSAPNKYDTESLVYNMSDVTYTLKILIDYTD